MTFLAQGMTDKMVKNMTDRQTFLKQNFENWH